VTGDGLERPPSCSSRSAAAKVDYPPLDKDADVDVCVVGGGIFGTLSAYEIHKRFPGKKACRSTNFN
jgi:ribulose 1,5-bisphosphate synthetase/thiazole synthase